MKDSIEQAEIKFAQHHGSKSNKRFLAYLFNSSLTSWDYLCEFTSVSDARRWAESFEDRAKCCIITTQTFRLVGVHKTILLPNGKYKWESVPKKYMHRGKFVEKVINGYIS